MKARVPGKRCYSLNRIMAAEVSPLPRYKLILLASVMSILAGTLGAQNPDSPGIWVAHPWDANSSLAGPTILAPLVPVLPLTTGTWTALGPAPIASGQRPGGGPVSGRIAGIAADPGNANVLYVAPAGGGVWKTTDGGAN